jgi:hypothetical protein
VPGRKGTPEQEADPASAIDERIAEHPDWRGAMLASVRKAILAVPGVVKE